MVTTEMTVVLMRMREKISKNGVKKENTDKIATKDRTEQTVHIEIT